MEQTNYKCMAYNPQWRNLEGLNVSPYQISSFVDLGSLVICHLHIQHHPSAIRTSIQEGSAGALDCLSKGKGDSPWGFGWRAAAIPRSSLATSVKLGLDEGSADQHLSIRDFQTGSHQVGIFGRRVLLTIPPAHGVGWLEFNEQYNVCIDV